jgi:hypothetical protein
LQQSKQSTQTVEVGLSRNLLTKHGLKKMTGVDSFIMNAANHCIIHTSNADLIKKQILQLAIEHQLNIDSLKSLTKVWKMYSGINQSTQVKLIRTSSVNRFASFLLKTEI